MRNISEAVARRMHTEAISPVYIRLFHITYMSSFRIRLYSTTPYIGLCRYGNSDDFDVCVKKILDTQGNDKKPLIAKKSTYTTGIYAKSDKERKEYDDFISAIKDIYDVDINSASDVSKLPEHSFAVRFYCE